MKRWLATLAVLLVSGTSVHAEEAKPRTLEQAIHLAIDLCSLGTLASNVETVEIKNGVRTYTHASEQLAQIFRSRNMGIDTTAEAPGLLKRFAATAAHSRMVGSRDFTILGAADGYVLIVDTAKRNMCDIGVTGIDEQAGLSDQIRSALDSKELWTKVTENSSTNEVVWNETYSFVRNEDEEVLGLITVRGLADNLAKPDGIQAELNFYAELPEEDEQETETKLKEPQKPDDAESSSATDEEES